jgi:hypothetical protein
MSPDFELIRRASAAFNECSIDGALSAMRSNVRRPIGMEGGVPAVAHAGPGRLVVDVPRSSDPAGLRLLDQRVEHADTLCDGLITRMDIRGGK